MENKQPLPEHKIYALDIGTRTVVGLVGSYIDDRFSVESHVAINHPERAMFDGQIHDIEKVAKVVKRVTEQLEQETGYQLKKVAIAAAGRALKTQSAEVTRQIDPTREIDKSTLDAIEIEALQQAQKQLESNQQFKAKYYCVGYSAVQYLLDDALIANPLEHRGSFLALKVIATFLPHSVVDSLYTVVDKLGLEVTNLTLEPIAAISVAIPQKFRLLNLALVDVGAGTSDIALTKAGAVYAYAMVDVAGDELTEALVQHYLMDFESAESLKMNLCRSSEQSFIDIVGIPYQKTTQEVLVAIGSEINRVAAKVAEGIVIANGGTPSAVFLIGGGCQVPGFSQALAEHLDLPKERVVIKGADALEGIHYQTSSLAGPEYITPLGIGYHALIAREQDFLQVLVNETPLRLFNAKQLLVSDALVLIGYGARRLIPERGKPLQYMLNHQNKRVSGTYGEAAKIYVNGSLASLDTPIKHKDAIVVEDAVQGTDATFKLSDAVDFRRQVFLEEGPLDLVRQIVINGVSITKDHASQYWIQPLDHVQIEALDTISDFMTFKALSEHKGLYVNGRQSHPSLSLRSGDFITFEVSNDGPHSFVKVADAKAELILNADNREPVQKPMNRYYFVVNQKTQEIETDRNPMIFVDLFEYIDFDLTKPQGIIDLKLNGERARYTDELKNGDVIDIGWRK